jgi:hypothetical protein
VLTRCHPETRAYIERKRSEGKTNRDAIRSLKRHLARRIWLCSNPTIPPHPHQPFDIGAARAQLVETVRGSGYRLRDDWRSHLS